jgi:hypothetical protein
MPVLTRSLIESIWVTFTSGRKDRFPAAAPAHLLRFLLAHRNGIAFIREAAGPDTGDYDEELNRLMLDSAQQAQRATSQRPGAHVVGVTWRRGDDDPDDGDGGGVREPPRPLPDPPLASAAKEADEEQP